MQEPDKVDASTEEERRRLFYCDHCTFATPFHSKLVSHGVVHSDARPFLCSLCDYAAKRKYDLKKHMHFKHKIFQSSIQVPLPSHPPMDATSITFIPNNHLSSPTTRDLSKADRCTPSMGDSDEASLPFLDSTSVKSERQRNEDDCYIIEQEQPIRIPYQASNVLMQTSQIMANITESCTGLAQSPTIQFYPPRPTVMFSSVDVSPMAGLASQELAHSSSHSASEPTAGQKESVAVAEQISVAAETTSMYSSTLVTSSNVTETGVGTSRSFQCPHCDIIYFDNALFVMHMGLHHADNPWQCNLCEEIYHDVYSFTSHFINQHKH